MMSTSFSRIFASGVIAASVIGFATAAAADEPAGGQRAPCFFVSQWQGWKAPRPDVLYLNVNMRDVYRVDLSAGSEQLMWPGVHLVSVFRGSDSVCSALDLDLAVSDGHGFKEHLIARSITKLTPDEIAAIPPKFRP